jgi:hypothetical protein
VDGDFTALVPDLLRRSPLVTGVELRGSRSRGTAGPYSDWDFVVTTDAFAELAEVLPELMAELEPLVQQWDRLSDQGCYMLIVPGPTKIDLIFEDVPHEHEPPWVVEKSTLSGIDDHVWDWLLWLCSKADAGKRDVVEAELTKMHHHLLEPMGVEDAPGSLGGALVRYLAARGLWEKRLRVTVDPRVGDLVAPLVAIVDVAYREDHDADG